VSKIHTTGNRFFYVLFCLSLGLSWFFHKDSTSFIDKDELWSDRAGYYIYLPTTFFYHFDARSMPADLDIKTGGGFAIDTLHNKMDTKYTYGVALLASPFFVMAGIISRLAGYHSEWGFSLIYMRMMHLAAVIYLMLGLWLLKKFLDYYFKPFISLFIITIIYFGTNLFFYSLIDGMMSHVYSFFLFSLFLLLLRKFHDDNTYRNFVLLCLTFALIVLIRPANIILGLIFLFWDAERPKEWLQRFRKLLNPAFGLTFLLILVVVFLPQMVYWKYLSGHWLYFSYGDEGFNNWRHPRILEVLFSPVNGLFTYTPILIFSLIGTAIMILRREANGLLILIIFLMVSMVCGSWKMWYFGCSLGQRPFIEYFTLFAMPFGYLTQKVITRRNFLLNTIFLFVVFLLVYFNLRYTLTLHRAERCYYGSTWDWDHYRRSVERAGIISPVHQVDSFENDFENLALSPVVRPSKLFTRSGLYSIKASSKDGITPLYTLPFEETGYPYPKLLDVSVWGFKPGARSTGASLGYSLNRGKEVLFREEQPIDTILTKTCQWQQVKRTFIVPDVNDSTLQIRIFVKNPGKEFIYFDDLHLKIHYRWD